MQVSLKYFVVVAVAAGLTSALYLSSPGLSFKDDSTSNGKIDENLLVQPVQEEKQPLLHAARLTMDEALQKIIKSDPSSKEGKLNTSLKEHVADIESLLLNLKRVEEKNLSIVQGQLESKTHELVVVQNEIHKQLEDARNSLSSEKIIKVDEFQKKVDQRFEMLNTLIISVSTASSNGELQRASRELTNYIGTLQKPRKTALLPRPTFQEPIDVEHQYIEADPASYMRARLEKSNMMVASSGSLDGLMLALEAPISEDEEAVSCNYSAEDLAASAPEIIFDPYITEKAKELDYNPLKIYSFVANEISFEKYSRSMKGATATLLSGAGNSYDQASLLSALLRVSKIPTRYVLGEIDFATEDDRGRNWMGVKSDAAFSAIGSDWRLFNDATRYGITGHVWVQACVPYDNYRGSVSDKSGYHWIPLDPSFEQYDYEQGDTVPVDFNLNDFLYGINGYMLSRNHKLPHEAFEEALSLHLGKPLHKVGYFGVKQEISHDVLPSTLPYQVRRFFQWGGGNVTSEATSIPPDHRLSLSITVKNSSGVVIHPPTRLEVPDISLKRTTLSFDGANGQDCLINPDVTPVITVEGEPKNIAGRSPQGLCDPGHDSNILKMDLHYGLQAIEADDPMTPEIELPNIINDALYESIETQNYHAIHLNSLQFSERLVELRTDEVLTNIAEYSDPQTAPDDTIGEYLHVVGLKYMGYESEANERIAELYGAYHFSRGGIGLTSTRRGVNYLFDLPYGISGNGFLIDVAAGISGMRDITTGLSNHDGFMLSGYTGSAYESYIWQEMGHLDAVSSVRGIQYAYETGMTVKILGSADVDNKPWGTTGYSDELLNFIRGKLIEGHQVVIPETNINYDNWWNGIVYIMNSGSVGTYVISGDYSGSAGGGFAENEPTDLNSYDSEQDTGFEDTLDSGVANDLMVGGSTSTTTSISYTEMGAGSGTGNVEGNTTSSGDPVNLVSGNMFHPERDFQLKGRGGLNIVFERMYNSHVRKDGPLGYGWTHSFNHLLRFFDSDANGTTDQVIWINGSGAIHSFDVDGTTSGVASGQSLSNQEGLYVTAKRESNGEYSIKERNGLTFYFESINGVDGSTSRLTRLIDRNGNLLNLTYAAGNLQAVTDDLGRSINFYYDDGNAHITRIVDWDNRTYRYSYDARNDLIKYETPLAVAGKQLPTTYTYYQDPLNTGNLDHAMESFTYPEGNGMTFEYYTNGKVFRHTDSDGHTYTFRYNKFRRETTTIDEKGIVQTYLFNERGQQIEHTQGDNSKLYYRYEDDGLNPDGTPMYPMEETVVRNALGYETIHDYDNDGSGDLIKSTLPDGSTLEYFGKTPFHKYCTVKNPEGNYTLNRYDSNGNTTQTIVLKKGITPTVAEANNCTYVPPAANIQAWNINTYDSVGNLKTSKRVRDFVTQAGPYIEYTYDANSLNPTTIKRCGYQHDINGNLLEQCVEATQTFDNLGRVTRIIGADFYPTDFEYDQNGRVVRKTDATGQWIELGYNHNGSINSQYMLAPGEDGKVGLIFHDTIEHDALNRPEITKNIAGFATRTEYDEIGNVIKITNPDGYSTRFEYDNMNRPTRAFDEHGHEVKTEYDIGGRPITVTDPNGIATQYEYYGASENGRLKKVTTPDNRTLEYFYDNNGNVIRTLDNTGREALTSYDSLNRPVRSVGPVHDSYTLPSIRQVTKTEYNELGYVTAIKAGYTNATGASSADVLVTQATYTYDDFGRMVSQTDAKGETTYSYYDIHGNLTKKASPNGHIVEYVYDHARKGLLITQSAKLSAVDQNPHVTNYSYNSLGQLTQVVTPEVTYDYGYDKANRLQSISDSRGGKVLTYDYSPGGRLNYVADSDGKRTDFLYDAASRLTAMLASNGERINFVFDAAGRLRETAMPNGYKAEYRYDNANNLEQLVNSTSQGIASQHDYTYDSSGRRETHTENIAGTTTAYKYIYDNLDRIKEVQKDAGATMVEQYAYDPFNNRRTRQPAGGPNYFYQYDDAHQLTTIKTGSDTGPIVANFQYDNSGNMINKSQDGVTRALTYDALERVVEVSGSDITTENYSYDHQGRRIGKTVGATNTQYLYSGMSIWGEFDATWGSALAHYNYTGVDQAIIRSTPNEADTRYYHNDGLGSPVAVSNTAGLLQASTRYDSWGNVIGGGGIPQFGFTGREPDATGFMYFRARFYDPTMGRFTQRDPIGFGGGLNPYTYVSNSPQNYTDPLGLAQAATTAGSSQTTAYPGTSSSSMVENECRYACHGNEWGDRTVLEEERSEAAGRAVISGLTTAIASAGCATTFSTCAVAQISLLETVRQATIFATGDDPLVSAGRDVLGLSHDQAQFFATGVDIAYGIVSVRATSVGFMQSSTQGVAAGGLSTSSLFGVSTATVTIDQTIDNIGSLTSGTAYGQIFDGIGHIAPSAGF